MRTLALGHRRPGAAKARPRGWWYPWLFASALGLVVAVNGVMIMLAIDGFSGLETAHPYERGLDYNRTLAAARAQDALGWQVDFGAAPVGQGTSPLSVDISARFRDRDGNGLGGMTVQAMLFRPAVQGLDFALPLTSRGGGQYAATTDLPMHGQWELRIVATGKDATWQSSRRILVP